MAEADSIDHGPIKLQIYSLKLIETYGGPLATKDNQVKPEQVFTHQLAFFGGQSSIRPLLFSDQFQQEDLRIYRAVTKLGCNQCDQTI